jgi:hypothetical protein
LFPEWTEGRGLTHAPSRNGALGDREGRREVQGSFNSFEECRSGGFMDHMCASTFCYLFRGDVYGTTGREGARKNKVVEVTSTVSVSRYFLLLTLLSLSFVLGRECVCI